MPSPFLVVCCAVLYHSLERTRLSSPIKLENTIELNKEAYRLSAVVVHVGGADSGHYTTLQYCLNGSVYYCDDETIRAAEDADLKTAENNCTVFVYTKKSSEHDLKWRVRSHAPAHVTHTPTPKPKPAAQSGAVAEPVRIILYSLIQFTDVRSLTGTVLVLYWYWWCRGRRRYR